MTRDPSGTRDLWYRYDGPDGAPEEQQGGALIQIAAHLDHAEAWWRDGEDQPHVVPTGG